MTHEDYSKWVLKSKEAKAMKKNTLRERIHLGKRVKDKATEHHTGKKSKDVLDSEASKERKVLK